MNYSLSEPKLTDIDMFSVMPGNSVLLLPDAPKFTIISATKGYCDISDKVRHELIGKGLFEAFPHNPYDQDKINENRLRSSLQQAFDDKEAHNLPFHRFDIMNAEGAFQERLWSILNQPVRDSSGEVVYLIHTVSDVSEKIKSELKKERIMDVEKAYNIFMSAPVIVGILQGDDYKIELANEGLLEVWGRTADVIGKPLLEAIPELNSQGFIALLDKVRTTGEPLYAYEYPITLNRRGKEEILYFDFVYKPLHDHHGQQIATGIISVGHDVTQQVTDRQKVQESEAKYRSIFETMDQGFCVLEMHFDKKHSPVDYIFLETNPVFEKQTGLKDAVGKTARELVPALERHWFERYGEVALTGEAVHFTERSDVMGRWFDVYAFRIGDQNSRKVALLFTDITESRKADEAIKLAEANIRNIVMQSPVAMSIAMGSSFVIEVANERMLELWGKRADEIVGRPVFDVLPEARQQGLEQIIQQVYQTGERFVAHEYPVMLIRRGREESLFLNFVYEPFLGSDGTITGVMVVAIDVTIQVKARKEVEEAHKEFQFVTDFMPQMIWITRPDGYHYYYNKQWYDYTGLTFGETQGECWNTAFHPEDQKRAWKMWRHSLNTGDPYEIEYRCRRFDGEYRWFLGRALPQKDDSGIILKWFGTCTDIHDQKTAAELMELRVEERTRELKQLNEQLKQFTYAASHDLQEPLRKINYFLDRLLNNLGPALNEESLKITERLQQTTLRMRNLIEDLLAYSNTSLGVIGFDEVNLEEIVNDVIDDMEASIIEHSAVITVHPLPVIRGDQRQLRQLFQNLISNSLKYHKKNEKSLVLITSKRVRGDEAGLELPDKNKGQHFHLIEVTDNGIGFEPENAERIFRLFQRLHGKTEYEGTGVGLAIVHKVIEKHNGFIWSDSEPGRGATFKMLFPMAE